MDESLIGPILRVGAVDSDDEKFMVKFSKIGNITNFVSGFAVQLLLDLKYALNFSLEAVPGQEFITDKNGTVGGMGAKLLNNEVDLVIASSYMLQYRVQHLSPTFPVSVDRIMIWFRQPQKYTEGNGFIKPFSPGAWFGISVILGIILLSALMVSRIEFHFGLRRHVSKTYFWILGAFCQRGSTKTPSRRPHRILFLQTFGSLWIIYTIYSASVLSRLTMTYNPFTSVSKLLDADFQILANPLTAYSRYFERSAIEKNWKTPFVGKMDSVSKVFQGGFGYITSKDAVGVAAKRLNFSDRDICESISFVPFFNLKLPLAFYTRKQDHYKEFINRKLLSIMENGLRRRYKDDFLRDTYPSCSPKSKTISSIDFPDVHLAFVIIFGACGASVVVLVGESVWNYRLRLWLLINLNQEWMVISYLD